MLPTLSDQFKEMYFDPDLHQLQRPLNYTYTCPLEDGCNGCNETGCPELREGECLGEDECDDWEVADYLQIAAAVVGGLSLIAFIYCRHRRVKRIRAQKADATAVTT